MSGTVKLTTLLAAMKPELLDDDMVFCSFQDATVQDELFLCPSGFFKERERITLTIGRSDAERFGVPFHTVLRAITLNVHSRMDAGGLWRRSPAGWHGMAWHGISANVVAAYYHNHIFVPASDAGRAFQALKGLLAEATASDVSRGREP